MDQIWDRKPAGMKKRMTTQNRQKSNAKKTVRLTWYLINSTVFIQNSHKSSFINNDQSLSIVHLYCMYYVSDLKTSYFFQFLILTYPF